MKNNLLEFSEKLEQKRVNDAKIKSMLEEKDSYVYFSSYTDNINFHLTYSIYTPRMLSTGNRYNEVLVLDNEDLEYFKNKYLPKIEDEYQTNLAELNSKYNK